MKYILMAFGLCFGASLYFGAGLYLVAILPLRPFEDIKESGNDNEVWMAMVLWPIYLITGVLMWCIEKIDELMEE